MSKNLIQRWFQRLLDNDSASNSVVSVGRHLFSFPPTELNQSEILGNSTLNLIGNANSQLIPKNLNRIWPFWVYKQLDPNSSDYHYSGCPFSFVNVTHRNWTRLSVDESEESVVVDPRGLISPTSGSWSLDFWIANSSKVVSPSQLKKTSQKLRYPAPTVDTLFSTEHLEVKSTVFCDVISQKPVSVSSVTIHNKSDKKVQLSFFFAIRPYNPEGVTSVKDIHYLSSSSFVINDRLGLVLDQVPDNVVCLDGASGDSSEHYTGMEMVLSAKCSTGQASAFAEYRLVIEPGESKVFSCRIPLFKQNRLTSLVKSVVDRDQLSKTTSSLRALSAEECLVHHNEKWTRSLAPLSAFEITDSVIQHRWNASVQHILSAIHEKGIDKGGFTYSSFKFEDVLKHIQALTYLSAFSATENALAHLPIIGNGHYDLAPQRTDHFGQLLFGLSHYLKMSNNLTLIEHFFPKVDHLVQKIMATVKNGQLTPTPANDDLGRSDIYFWDLSWNLVGIRSAIFIAQKLGRKEKLERLFSHDAALTSIFDQWIAISAAESTPPLLPLSQKRRNDQGLISSLVCATPMPLLPLDHESLRETVSFVISHFSIKDVVFNTTGKQGFNVENNFKLAHVLSRINHPHFHEVFKWLTTQCSSTGTWPESIHPKSNGGCAGEGHYLAANADYVILIRHMIIQEKDNYLELFPTVPKEWLSKNGSRISLSGAATEFGPVSISITRDENTLTVRTDLSHCHSLPKNIILHCPFTIESCSSKGQILSDNCIQLGPKDSEISLSIL